MIKKETVFYCDREGCKHSINMGEWTSQVTQLLQERGWYLKKIDGIWKHFCPPCWRHGAVEALN